MKKKIFVGDTKGFGTTILKAKHKKDGSVNVQIHAAKRFFASREIVDPKEYKKKDALLVINFQNIQAVDTFLIFLNAVRDNLIYLSGQKKAYDKVDQQIHTLFTDPPKEESKQEETTT